MVRALAMLAAFQWLMCVAASARELPPDLRALIEGFQAHRRIAAGYLRTQNGDLGAVEIERLRERWSTDRRKLTAASVADAALAAALARTEVIVGDSLKAVDGGDIERARLLLEDAARPLDDWRRAKGFRLFSDCIAEVTAAYEQLDVYRRKRPDLADRPTAGRVVRASNDAVTALERCDREAPDDVKREPEFRRLVDGMLGSLRQVPEAVGAGDAARLHRLLIEQRAFERLLSFRFG